MSNKSQRSEETQELERAVKRALTFFTLEQIRQLVREMEEEMPSGPTRWIADRNRRRPIMRQRPPRDALGYRNN